MASGQAPVPPEVLADWIAELVLEWFETKLPDIRCQQLALETQVRPWADNGMWIEVPFEVSLRQALPAPSGRQGLPAPTGFQ